MGIGQIRRHIGDANLAGNKITEFDVVLAVILINDTCSKPIIINGQS